ncbi:gamma-glutamyltransferase [Pseudomonadota bacterium]|nr:gamma-glutamyltransferase [Pseudomonadota bacterium]
MFNHLACLIISGYLFIAPAHADTERSAAIATAHPLATQAGFEILDQGGNAFDAAVAITAALAVVEPSGSGLGGGGFWLLHRDSDKFQTMLDGREKAPSAAHPDMYLDKSGQANPKLSLEGPLAAGIPGVPAALVHLTKQYGNLSLAQNLAPAIRYAKQGFGVSEHYQKLAQFRLAVLNTYPNSQSIFLKNKHVPELGDKIIQTDLANTLQQIASYGRDGFYKGDIAQKLVDDVQKHGGIWTLDDLNNYQVIERQAMVGNYKGYTITSAALPSSGGITLLSMLNQLETLPFETSSQSQRQHLIIETMRRAYRDRNHWLGDSDFINVPTEKLISKAYAKQLASSIDFDLATPNSRLEKAPPAKGEDTTHFSIIDQNGNRVSATLSINYPFGSGFVAKGTGVLLNDEMDDFSSQQGSANGYGLVADSNANQIEPNKRPLSSMSPTFIENDQQLLIIGTPGGSRIITMVLLGMLDFIDDKSAQQIVSEPRFHHQHLPNHVQFESIGFSDSDVEQLTQRGHEVKKLGRQYGNMQVIIHNKSTQQSAAASDPRGEGESLVRAIKKH